MGGKTIPKIDLGSDRVARDVMGASTDQGVASGVKLGKYVVDLLGDSCAGFWFHVESGRIAERNS